MRSHGKRMRLWSTSSSRSWTTGARCWTDWNGEGISMVDLPMRAEAVEAAAKAMWEGENGEWERYERCYSWEIARQSEDGKEALRQARAAIAAFCEAEGLTVEDWHEKPSMEGPVTRQ